MKAILTGLVTTLFFSNAFATSLAPSLPDSVIKYHEAVTGDQCEKDNFESPMTFELGNGYKLHLAPCFFAAYQGASRAYITQNEQDPTQVMVLADEDGLVPSLDLGDASFNAKTGILDTFSKGRGIGDCGQSSQTRIKLDKEFGSLRIKTIEIRSKQNCDGKMTKWPVVFRQK